MATAPVFEGRPPSPSARKVRFAAPTQRGGFQQQRRPLFGGRGVSSDVNVAQRASYMPPPQRPNYFVQQTSGQGQCPKCGRENHAHPNYCPAINKNCNYCGKRGHFSKVCRAAMRNRVPTRYD